MSEPVTLRINDVDYVRKDALQDKPESLEEQRSKNPHWPFELGKKYMIRTVTMHDHGTLIGVTEHFLVLKKASWIPDSGRWWNFITGKSKPNEVEPFDADKPLIVGIGGIIDAQELDASFGDQK